MDRQAPKIGLALGAGGIRGCAHIGVLKVLAEESIRIDCVAGASAGAVIGAGFAGGMTPQDIEEAFLALSLGDYLRFYLDRLHIRRSSGVGRTVLELGDSVNLEDLPIPCAVVALDLQRKERVVLREGPAVEVVKAAIAIPFVSGPTILAGRRLYDGGLIDPLPVDLPRQMGADRVIAVDVGKPFARAPLAFLGKIINSSLSTREFGNLIELMGGKGSQTYTMPPDLLLCPDLRGVGPNSVRHSSIKRAIARGEACARAALPGIRRLVSHSHTPPVL